jgi:hypothetical protein
LPHEHAVVLVGMMLVSNYSGIEPWDRDLSHPNYMPRPKKSDLCAEAKCREGRDHALSDEDGVDLQATIVEALHSVPNVRR